jgi:hypothetical protein
MKFVWQEIHGGVLGERCGERHCDICLVVYDFSMVFRDRVRFVVTMCFDMEGFEGIRDEQKYSQESQD